MALAHIRSGAIVKRFGGETGNERGWVELEDGRKVSPPIAGFVDGNDSVVPVEIVNTDTSTSSDTIQERVTVVEASRVLITNTTRDLIPTEVEASRDAEADRLSVRVLLVVIRRLLNQIRALEDTVNGTSQGALTLAQVRNRVRQIARSDI